MGNPRQRRKARSSAHKTVKHSRHAKRNLKKMKPIRGPKALQDAWDKKKTLRQNYAIMGLVGSLKQADSGGSEYPLPTAEVTSLMGTGPSKRPILHLSKDTIPRNFGRILRDADGNIIGAELPEDEPDRQIEDDEAMSGCDIDRGVQRTEVVDALERLANWSQPVPRFSSCRETASLRQLIAKHEHDFEGMAKDRRLNVWQRTAGQLERASKKAGLV